MEGVACGRSSGLQMLRAVYRTIRYGGVDSSVSVLFTGTFIHRAPRAVCLPVLEEY